MTILATQKIAVGVQYIKCDLYLQCLSTVAMFEKFCDLMDQYPLK
jgi:hypothetical protein